MNEKVYKQVTINISGADTKQTVHEKFKQALHFPSYYGNNLDALFDCLMDMKQIDLSIYMEKAFFKQWPDYADQLYTLFEDVCKYNQHIKVHLKKE